jgi:hypothetical protein
MPQAHNVDSTRRWMPEGRAGFQTLRDNRRALAVLEHDGVCVAGFS